MAITSLVEGLIRGLKRRAVNSNVSVMEYIQETFPSYRVNWHHRIITNAIEEWLEDDNKINLMISCPPRHGKSEICSTRLPGFIFGKNPDAKIISCSYSARLSARNSRFAQDVMDSRNYQKLFPDVRLATRRDREIRTRVEFGIVGHRGQLLSAGVNGSITGDGMTYGIIDDPVKNRQEANSPTIQDGVWDWYRSTFLTRLEKGGRILLVMTRWQENDLAGKLLAAEKDKWRVVNMPGIYDSNIATEDDDYRNEGEALWPDMYSLEFLQSMRESMGEYEFSALYQGDPHTDADTIFKPGYWQYYEKRPEDILFITQSWDTALKEGRENDFSVCTTWATTNHGYYLLHVYRDKLDFPKLKTAMKMMASAWHPSEVLVEDKASGISAIQELRKTTMIPIIACNPTDSKIQRAHVCTGVLSSGKVFLPVVAPWLRAYVEELRKFPKAPHDDQADSTSQFLSRAIVRDGLKSFTDISMTGR